MSQLQNEQNTKPSDRRRKMQENTAENFGFSSFKRQATAGNDLQQRMLIPSQDVETSTDCRVSQDITASQHTTISQYTTDESAVKADLPDGWKPMRDDEKMIRVVLNENDAEYKMVTDNFYRSMNLHNDEIVQVPFKDYCC